MGDPRVRDHDVHAAVGEHRLLEADAHGRLAGHVHADADGPSAADRRDHLVRHLARPRLVEVGHDHVRAFRGQTQRRGPADARGAARDEGDAAGELLLGRGLGQLVELERPVLDVERVPGGERHVAPEGGGGAEDRDGVVIDVAHDAGRAPVLPRGEHPEPGDGDHAREGIGESGPRRIVGIDIGGVVDDEAIDRRLDGVLDDRGIVGVSDGDEAGQPLRIDRVIGRGRSDPRQLARLARAGEVENIR